MRIEKTSLGVIHLHFRHISGGDGSKKCKSSCVCRLSRPDNTEILSARVKHYSEDLYDRRKAEKFALEKLTSQALKSGILIGNDVYQIFQQVRERFVNPKYIYTDGKNSFYIDKMSKGHLREALKRTLYGGSKKQDSSVSTMEV